MNIEDKQLILNVIESQKQLDCARELLHRAFATRNYARANAKLCTNKALVKRLQAIDSEQSANNSFRFRMFEDQIRRINENTYDFTEICAFTEYAMFR